MVTAKPSAFSCLRRVWLRRTLSASVQILLQYHRRGRGIQPRLPLAPVTLPLCQSALGLHTSQPLVLKRDRHPQPPSKQLSNGTNALRIFMRSPIEVNRQTDNQSGDLIAIVVEGSHDVRDSNGHLASYPFSRDRLPRRRKGGAGITHGQSDPMTPEINSHDAHPRRVTGASDLAS